MIIIKELNTLEQINDACILLYKSHIEHMKWNFLPDNPSQIRVEVKNGKKMLIDRFTYSSSAIWFGAFDKEKLIGCTRLCKAVDGKLEMEGYESSYPIQRYLPKNKSRCVESTRTAVMQQYTGKGIAKLLLLTAFKYCEVNHYSMAASVSHNYLKSYLRDIGLPLKMEHAFKYEPQDPFPVNFYFADYNKGDLKRMIKKMENTNKNNKENDILEALTLAAQIIPVPVYWHDKDGVVLGLNEHCLKSIGASKQEDIIGKTPYDFYPEEIAEHILTHNLRVMQTGEILSQDERIRDIKTGETKFFRNTKAPLYDKKGNIIGIIGSAIDITAEKENKNLKVKIESQEIFKQYVNKMYNDMETLRLNIVDNSMGENKSRNNEEEKIHLTKRESEVLYLRSLDKNAKQIGVRLGISTATVNSVINKGLYRKFKVGDQNSLVEKAKRLKLIPFLHDSFMGSK